MTEQILTIEEVAKHLRVTRATIYNLLKDGNFPPGFKVGRVRRWKLSQIQEFMDAPAKAGE